MFFVFQFLASATTNPTVREPNANSRCRRGGKHAWTSEHRKVFANLFDHGVAVLAFAIAAKVKDHGKVYSGCYFERGDSSGNFWPFIFMDTDFIILYWVFQQYQLWTAIKWMTQALKLYNKIKTPHTVKSQFQSSQVTLINDGCNLKARTHRGGRPIRVITIDTSMV